MVEAKTKGRVLSLSAGDRIRCAQNLRQDAQGQAKLKRQTGQREGLGCHRRNYGS